MSRNKEVRSELMNLLTKKQLINSVLGNYFMVDNFHIYTLITKSLMSEWDKLSEKLEQEQQFQDISIILKDIEKIKNKINKADKLLEEINKC